VAPIPKRKVGARLRRVLLKLTLTNDLRRAGAMSRPYAKMKPGALR
jgi:hypothetical protein